LSREYEPSRPSTGETGKERCNVLTPSSLRINDEFYFLRKFIGFYGGGAVMVPPRSKQLNDPLSAGVVDLERFDAVDRIATSQGDARVPAPFCPSFETAERLAAYEHGSILAPPSPDR
jgi:hypothetical protein